MAYAHTDKVKDALGLSGNTYQDKPLQLYINEVIEDMIDSGVKRAIAESEKAVGTVAIGVLDIWTNTSGKVTHSPYFFDRCIKLSYETPSADGGDNNGGCDCGCDCEDLQEITTEEIEDLFK